MKRLLFLIILVSVILRAGANETQEKVQFKFGGRVDALGFVDTYESKATRQGIHYYFPLAPDYNQYGNDLNKETSLRFGATPTRLNGTVLFPDLIGAKGKVFVEADFMGTSDNSLGLVRLRHAYIQLDWVKGQLIAGQTDHLAIPVEIAPNAISYGGGAPINPLSRAVQLRYTHKLTQHLSLAAAVGMFGGTEGDMQSDAATPDMQVKLAWKEQDRWMVGFSAGCKSIRPRKRTDDQVKTSERMSAFNVSAYGLCSFGRGYKLKLFGMWGEDLSTFTMMGGFAPKLADIQNGEPDYGYVPVRALATWLEFETPLLGGHWQPGIFAGWTKNLGTAENVDLTKAVIGDYGAAGGIDWHLRIAPQLYYNYKRLWIGLEYMYALASWGEDFSTRFRPIERYENVSNHRVTLLTRFKF